MLPGGQLVRDWCARGGCGGQLLRWRAAQGQPIQEATNTLKGATNTGGATKSIGGNIGAQISKYIILKLVLVGNQNYWAHLH